MGPEMTFDDALRRYRGNAFTDQDVTRCAGLGVRAWRELIKLGTVRTTAARGRGRVRLCDAVTLKRAAVIGALNGTGLSLAVSGQIAYFLPYHPLLYSVCDPITILRRGSADVEADAGLTSRDGQPQIEWFDPDKPAKADPATDWLIEIYEGRFVGAIYESKDEPIIFGDLRNQGTSFCAWLPLHPRSQIKDTVTADLARQLLPEASLRIVGDWNPGKFPRELRVLGYNHEDHADGSPLHLAAEATAGGPVFASTINVSLAIRKALRRYLEIEPAATSSPGLFP
jgi:hypothetical protein